VDNAQAQQVLDALQQIILDPQTSVTNRIQAASALFNASAKLPDDPDAPQDPRRLEANKAIEAMRSDPDALFLIEAEQLCCSDFQRKLTGLPSIHEAGWRGFVQRGRGVA
jgi:hypothetical protein